MSGKYNMHFDNINPMDEIIRVKRKYKQMTNCTVFNFQIAFNVELFIQVVTTNLFL